MTTPSNRGGRPRTSDVRRTYRILHRHVTALEWWRRQRGLPDQAAALRSVLDALDEMRRGGQGATTDLPSESTAVPRRRRP